MITLRAVTDADAVALYRWRNDDEARKYSGSSGRIPWQEHITWFGNRLLAGAWLIATSVPEATAVGTVRWDRHLDDRTWISVLVAPEHRGRGVGAAIVLVATGRRAGPVYARIHEGNAPSLRIFARAGYVRLPEEDDGVWQTWWRMV